MKKKYKKKVTLIATVQQIQNCLSANSLVEVWVQGEYDKQGVIDMFTDELVRIDKEYYVRNQCAFYTVSTYLKLIVGGKS